MMPDVDGAGTGMGGRVLISPVTVGLIGSFVAGFSSTDIAGIVRWALIAGGVVALVLALLAQRAGRDRPGFPARSLLVTATAVGLVMATAASAVAVRDAPAVAIGFWLICVILYAIAWLPAIRGGQAGERER